MSSPRARRRAASSFAGDELTRRRSPSLRAACSAMVGAVGPASPVLVPTGSGGHGARKSRCAPPRRRSERGADGRRRAVDGRRRCRQCRARSRRRRSRSPPLPKESDLRSGTSLLASEQPRASTDHCTGRNPFCALAAPFRPVRVRGRFVPSPFSVPVPCVRLDAAIPSARRSACHPRRPLDQRPVTKAHPETQSPSHAVLLANTLVFTRRVSPGDGAGARSGDRRRSSIRTR